MSINNYEHQVKMLLKNNPIDVYLPYFFDPSPRLSYFLSSFFKEENLDGLQDIANGINPDFFFYEKSNEPISPSYTYGNYHYILYGLSTWDTRTFIGIGMGEGSNYYENLMIVDATQNYYALKLEDNPLMMVLAQHIIHYFSGHLMYEDKNIQSIKSRTQKTPKNNTNSLFSKEELISGSKGYTKLLDMCEQIQVIKQDIVEKALKDYKKYSINKTKKMRI